MGCCITAIQLAKAICLFILGMRKREYGCRTRGRITGLILNPFSGFNIVEQPRESAIPDTGATAQADTRPRCPGDSRVWCSMRWSYFPMPTSSGWSDGMSLVFFVQTLMKSRAIRSCMMIVVLFLLFAK